MLVLACFCGRSSLILSTSVASSDDPVSELTDGQSLVRSRLARRSLVAQGEPARVLLTESWKDERRWSARWEILETLREIGHPATAPTFRAALRDPAFALRATAVEALSALSLEVDVPRWLELTNDPAWPVRRAVAVACARESDRSTAESLVRLAADSDDSVRRAALRSLSRRRDLFSSRSLGELLSQGSTRGAVFQHASPAGRPDMAPAFARALAHVQDSAASITVAVALSRSRPPLGFSESEQQLILDRLLSGLCETEHSQTRAVAAALRSWGPDVAPRLRALLATTTNAAALLQIWNLLVELEGTSLTSFAQERVLDGIPQPAIAIRSLEHIADEDVFAFLQELWESDTDPAVQQAILAVAESHRSPRTSWLIAKGLEASDFRTRLQAAAQVVARREDGMLADLLTQIDSEPAPQQTQFLRLLAEWPHPRVEQWLLARADRDEPRPLRRAALEVLGTYQSPSGGEDIVAHLQRLLNEALSHPPASIEEEAGSRRTRVILARSLITRLGPKGIVILKRLLEVGAVEADEDLIRSVVGASSPLPPGERLELLQGVLADPRLKSFSTLLRGAARRLASAGDASAATFMLGHFDSASADERISLVPELAEFRHPGLDQRIGRELEAAVAGADLDFPWLQALIEYCLSRRSPDLLPALLQLAEREGAPLALRTAALEAIADTSPSSEVEPRLLALVERTQSHRPIGPLAEEEELLLRRVFEALGRVGSVSSIPVLSQQLFAKRIRDLEAETWSYYQDPNRSLADSLFAWEGTLVRALARHSEPDVQRELLSEVERLKQSGQLFLINDDSLVFVGRALLQTDRPTLWSLAEEILGACLIVSPNPSAADFEARYWLALRALSCRDYRAAGVHLDFAIDHLWADVLSTREARARIDRRAMLVAPRQSLGVLRCVAQFLETEDSRDLSELELVLREVAAPDADLLMNIAELLLVQSGPTSLINLSLNLATESDPDRSDLARLRARHAALESNWNEAAAELVRALQWAARDGLCDLGTLHVERARCLIKAERVQEARAALERAYAEDASWHQRVKMDPAFATLFEAQDGESPIDRRPQ